MNRRWLWLVILGIAIMGFWNRDTLKDMVTRGKRLTTSSGDPVTQTPAQLAAEASRVAGHAVSVEAYALARMIRSENGSGTVLAKQAVAHVALNDARAHGWTLLYTLTVNSRRPAGSFGSQRGGRYSTSRDPYENDLVIAEYAISGVLPDPTGGADKFVHKGAFGVQEGTGSYDSVVRRWAADGYQPTEIPGTGDLVVFNRGVA